MAAWSKVGSLFSFLNFQRILQQRRQERQQQPQSERIREVQIGRHPIKTHGAKVARDHLHDWLILMLLVVIEVVLFIIHPFYRFVGKDMMTDLKYPMKQNTVPVWAVPMYSVLLPICVFLVVYHRRRDVYDLHHSVLGLLFAVLITAIVTDAIKVAVGRPRPDFFWRCFPDGKDNYDQWGNVICHGNKADIKEGHKSFPSGHASWSFAGLGYLSLYLSGKIKVFNREGHIARLCIIFLPLLAASLVAVSRVDDYWHHWNDVFAGGFLGLVVAAFCYRQFFPNPYEDEGWGPYAYFDALLEEANANREAAQTTNADREAAQTTNADVEAAQTTNANREAAQTTNADIEAAQTTNANREAAQTTNANREAAQTTNALIVQKMEVQAVNQTSGSNGDNFSSPPLVSSPSWRLDDIELGRR
ncbi:PREDICTED: lipid phosphate phosphatase 2 isoform X3 [Theobroma cacao]|uniref:Lipid phosphate phosphatase 2 isoform X3 n=1 Tax=Theobroma cacao TaxID=3641 RepID=A0AB32VGG0_THECC|nr:PREDICTED: lipid phosphate phosphatase 2 isoform X3 [Theobroma cacao]XP_007044213.2 PREDICTED: lipid phosphate phosphatase 2 isoform X3 [Theobroma cacao]